MTIPPNLKRRIIMAKETIKKTVKKAVKKTTPKKDKFVTMTRADGLKANVHPNNVAKFKDAGYR